MAAAAVGAPVKPASPASIEERQQLIPGLLRWVALCNNGAEVAAAGRLVELTCDGSTVGMLRPEFAAHLQQHAAVFRPTAAGGLELAPGLATQQQRTDAVAGVLQQLREEGLVSGWRNELYPVVRSFHSEPAFLIERAAAPHFGIKAYGELWVGWQGGAAVLPWALGQEGVGLAAAARLAGWLAGWGRGKPLCCSAPCLMWPRSASTSTHLACRVHPPCL